MEEDVFWLDIPVDDVVVVQVLNRVADLLDDTPHFILGQPPLRPQIGV